MTSRSPLAFWRPTPSNTPCLRSRAKTTGCCAAWSASRATTANDSGRSPPGHGDDDGLHHERGVGDRTARAQDRARADLSSPGVGRSARRRVLRRLRMRVGRGCRRSRADQPWRARHRARKRRRAGRLRRHRVPAAGRCRRAVRDGTRRRVPAPPACRTGRSTTPGRASSWSTSRPRSASCGR